MQYNPCAPDSYSDHIGRVSEEQPCVALQDVHNEFGLLLVKKGSAIGSQLAAKMAEHTLDQALDDAVGLESTLTQQSLLSAFYTLATQHPDFVAVTDQRGAQGLLDTLCLRQPLPRILMQKLSVMQLQLPQQFDQSLLGAWLAALIALAGQWSTEAIYQAFCGALFRDLGLLHITPELVVKEPPLSQQERRSLSVHPRVSQKIIMDTASYGADMAKAVAEHHEHPAGIGYPAGKIAKRMTEKGLLLALSDLLCRIYHERTSLAATLPYLRAAFSVYNLPIQRVAYRLLAATELAEAKAEPMDAEQLSDRAIEQLVSIGAVFAFLVTLQEQLRQGLKEQDLTQQTLRQKAQISGAASKGLGPQGEYLLHRIEEALTLLRTTGLASIDMLSLLDEMRHESAVELLDTAILEQEFLHIAEHIYRLGARWLGNEKTLTDTRKKTIRETLRSIHEVVEQCEGDGLFIV